MNYYHFDGPDSKLWTIEAESLAAAIDIANETAFDTLWRSANDHMSDEEYELADAATWSDPTWQRQREEIIKRLEEYSWTLAYRGKSNDK